ncbi:MULTISPECIES: protein adenylyltransferase SelO [unclassified Prochlorococcus]|uniref:protein adenylyltransferase SelO n=1 Tax=unclassified Prochlorococcus TaxID=2627481 RepID=UPI000533B6B5|nr:MULTISPECIES: protein adenylyltransferase SelO family protein [unclassified Prochlorococcus]KGG14872.1 Selenoprotein O-like [Prochlorococcus sp. MIT 0602]KGG15696.1 Selenoprotein O-like [Prochlorococcus sp. MIT 0603]
MKNLFEASTINTFAEFSQQADYSLMDSLQEDPQATDNGHDHLPRQVFSGHYVPVTPTPIPAPEYIAHSKIFFNELGLSHNLALDAQFRKLFSGDTSVARKPMRPIGWVTGYALSIYGTEYIQQCPFGTGNGYGDGRAISVFEGLFNGRRWEMQLKGGGPTPYCRGADGRAVLRSSMREFLAQDYMQALGVPTSRSLTLYVSRSETVRRPWYSKESSSIDPDILVDNPVAITTRVAPSFLRVGQIELFARRARSNAHQGALNELQMIVKHLIERNYKQVIDPNLPFNDQVVELAQLFRGRLISLVANWIRIGYCQGNFNSDNCAAGGFTLDYGPFGFCEMFDPKFQPWTGGGNHFSFFNQPLAAEANYHMFWAAIRPLLKDNSATVERLDQIREGFTEAMSQEIEAMWAKKLGLISHDATLTNELLELMTLSKVDYTIFFRKLSNIPEQLSILKESFYQTSSEQIDARWSRWIQLWRNRIRGNGELKVTSAAMKRVNPKYTWREWMIAPAYEKAELGDYSLIKELQDVLSNPYDEQSLEVEMKYNRLKPKNFFNIGGISHYSCSS